MTKPTTISEVLDDVYAPQIMNNDTCLECGINFTQARDEALASIKQIIEEQVIGENRLVVGNSIQRQMAIYGNQLRAEQRESLNTVLGK